MKFKDRNGEVESLATDEVRKAMYRSTGGGLIFFFNRMGGFGVRFDANHSPPAFFLFFLDGKVERSQRVGNLPSLSLIHI